MDRTEAAVLILGCGFTGLAVARLATARAERVVATTRDAGRAPAIRQSGAEVAVLAPLEPARVAELAAGAGSRVVVTFPPDGETDAALAPALAGRRVAYVSSTSVLGRHRGAVDDTTPVDREDARARPRLAAEDAWRSAGAVVLRAPGIYGPGRGLHQRIAEGRFRVPGDGAGWSSRIHVTDLAALLLAALDRGRPGEAYLVGDLEPAPLVELVRFVVARLGCAMPPSVEPSAVHETLRADRRVDGSRALRELGVTLQFPGYRAGYAAALEGPRTG